MTRQTGDVMRGGRPHQPLPWYQHGFGINMSPLPFMDQQKHSDRTASSALPPKAAAATNVNRDGPGTLNGQT